MGCTWQLIVNQSVAAKPLESACLWPKQSKHTVLSLVHSSLRANRRHSPCFGCMKDHTALIYQREKKSGTFPAQLLSTSCIHNHDHNLYFATVPPSLFPCNPPTKKHHLKVEISHKLTQGEFLWRPQNTDSQILAILKQNDNGISVPDLCREHGMSSATFYKWRAKYGGMDASLMKRMKELEDENRRLKKMYAEERLKAEIRLEALEGKY